jgi:hypothetical protein
VEARHLQESAWKCDDKFVGSLDETVLDTDSVCHELILGSDKLSGQPELDETQSETSPPLKNVLAVLETGFLW